MTVEMQVGIWFMLVIGGIVAFALMGIYADVSQILEEKEKESKKIYNRIKSKRKGFE